MPPAVMISPQNKTGLLLFTALQAVNVTGFVNYNKNITIISYLRMFCDIL